MKNGRKRKNIKWKKERDKGNGKGDNKRQEKWKRGKEAKEEGKLAEMKGENKIKSEIKEYRKI